MTEIFIGPDQYIQSVHSRMTKATVPVPTPAKQFVVCQQATEFVLSCLQGTPEANASFSDHVVTGIGSLGPTGRDSVVLILKKFSATAGPYKSRPRAAPVKPKGGINTAAAPRESMPPKILTIET